MNYIPKIVYGTGPTTITFELPPTGDNLDEVFKSNNATNTSNSGMTQTQWNYNEHIFSPKFTFITQALHDSIYTFFIDWGSKGKEFKYYESSDEAEFFTVTLTKKELKPKKLVCDGMSGFIWEFELEMRHVI
jgi:hypothetical protein